MALAITYEQIEAEWNQKIQQGIEQGVQQGIEQGVQQGIEQGIEQGAVAKSREIALAMLREGMAPETVARLTQLPLDQLPSLDEPDPAEN